MCSSDLYLLDAIDCSNAELQAVMASIRNDAGPGGMRNDFELAAAQLLPADPVAKKRVAAGTKRGSAEILETNEEAKVSAFGTKASIGKSGVHLRYHKPEEYKKLSEDQKDELREWRKTKKGKAENTNDSKRYKSDRKAIATLVDKPVEKNVAAKLKALKDKAAEDEQA